jgi:serine phosphatase RsbU (regulator of sigma subunit)/ligand-binding sensor domain-containing protein
MSLLSRYIIILSICAHSVCNGLNLFGQNEKNREIGFFPIHNYSPKDYEALPQNWAIVQDFRGNIYVGNKDGILEFDGTNWNKINTSLESEVRSLSIDKEGTIFVGAVNEFGLLKPDKGGSLIYYPISDSIPKGNNDFGDIWKTHSLLRKVYFQAENKLFIYENDTIKVIKSVDSYSNSFLVNNTLFLEDFKNGLFRIHNDSLLFIDGSNMLIDKRLYALLSYDQNIMFGAINKDGMFFFTYFEDKNLIEIIHKPTEIDDFLTKNQIYCGILLPDNLYSIGTFNGAGVINKDGYFQYWINKQIGIIDENIKCQTLDRVNNLWLGLQNGVCQIQISSPITFFNEKHLLKGNVESITRYKNRLRIATSLGVYELLPSKNKNLSKFIITDGISSSETWVTTVFHVYGDDILLVVKNNDIIEISDKSPEPEIIYHGIPWTICQLKTKKGEFLFGLEDGAILVQKNESLNWNTKFRIKGIEQRITEIKEDNSGNIWLGGETDGIYKISADSKEINENSKVQFFIDSVGFPESPYIFTMFHDSLLIGAAKGIYYYQTDQNKILLEPLLNYLMGNNLRYIHRMSVDPSGKLWLVTYIEEEEREEIGFFDYDSDSNLFWNPTPFLGNIKGQINAIYHDIDGVTWLGGSEGLFRYDSKVSKDYAQDFNCLIRNVKLGEDSTLFYGTYYDDLGHVSLEQPKILKPVLQYAYNSIVFNYSAMNIDVDHPTQYSYFLEGYDKKWSEWITKTEKEYTNLPEGRYIFRAKAKNIYNHESQEGNYEFEILPPWYRTWVAYFGFLLTAFALIYLFVKQYTRYLRGVIREKTAEIRHQKDEIEKINEEITSSIKYAERIQKAIVPTYQKASEILPEHFVLWRPRDIVSGDFWWMTQKNGLVVIVAADCTGHGVPGAFMSMLGVSFLNEIVNKNEITTANVILDDLRHHVKSTLKQTGKEGEAKDGMDLALIVLDIENQRIQFAGAYNPLYLIRQNELIEFKADRNPIGIFIKEMDSFTNNLIEIQKGDTLYIFSDGFVDQFGGSDGRKFKSKQFKELLLAIQDRSMLEQEMILDKAIDDWRGEMAQVDDILVLGIRI